MDYNITVLSGDGIGPEIMEQALLVLDQIGHKYGHKFNYEHRLIGGAAIDQEGAPLSDATIEACKNSHAVLLGAVGGKKWDSNPPEMRPEKGLLAIREKLGLFANLRPAITYKSLINDCPIKGSDGFDILFVRELTGDVYFGEKGRKDNGTYAFDEMNYNVKEIERIGRKAFELARKRKGRLCSVDKANVLETSRLWREVMHRIKDEYPDVAYKDMYVDTCAMQLIRSPKQFDVIVTGNLFGDILSDEASMLTGSIGMLPSASFGSGTFGLYEPIHGSAPDIAGNNTANPIATILSVAMMLRHSLGLEEEAKRIEDEVAYVLDEGHRTVDIAAPGENSISTAQMGARIANSI